MYLYIYIYIYIYIYYIYKRCKYGVHWHKSEISSTGGMVGSEGENFAKRENGKWEKGKFKKWENVLLPSAFYVYSLRCHIYVGSYRKGSVHVYLW